MYPDLARVNVGEEYSLSLSLSPTSTPPYYNVGCRRAFAFVKVILYSNDVVFSMNRLREVGMPADFVNKLARMFQDIKVSEDLNQQFKESIRTTTKSSVAGRLCFHITVFISQ